MQALGVFGILLAVFAVFSYLALRSLAKLSPKFSHYYEFGGFFPKAGRWSIIVYAVILAIILSLVLYFGRDQIREFFPA